MSARAQFADQNIDRGFQRPILVRSATAAATTTVAQCRRRGYYCRGENRCLRQQDGGRSGSTPGGAPDENQRHPPADGACQATPW
jgi:hypothetical protein